jgi:NADPH-dependent ferric siderophore reductase
MTLSTIIGTPLHPTEPPLAGARVTRVRHELQRRSLQVLRVEAPSPHFRRVVFGGPALAGFVSASFDDHVKFMLEGAGEPVRRDYTPRRHDASAGELTIEFALHGDGPVAAWAAQAAPGAHATIAGPRGSFIIDATHDWHLLAGDATALPAIARRLEELPADVQALVVLQVEAADRRELPSAARVQLQWVDDAPALLQAVRALRLPAGAGYAWCAGEAAVMAALRRVLVEEHRIDGKSIRAAAYWKRGAAGHHENV